MTKVFHITCSSRRFNHSSAGTAGIFIVLLIMAVFMALPMVLIIGNAFKPSHELWAFPYRLDTRQFRRYVHSAFGLIGAFFALFIQHSVYNSSRNGRQYNFRFNVRVCAFKAAVSGKENYAAAGCSFAYV